MSFPKTLTILDLSRDLRFCDLFEEVLEEVLGRLGSGPVGLLGIQVQLRQEAMHQALHRRWSLRADLDDLNFVIDLRGQANPPRPLSSGPLLRHG